MKYAYIIKNLIYFLALFFISKSNALSDKQILEHSFSPYFTLFGRYIEGFLELFFLSLITVSAKLYIKLLKILSKIY